MTTIKYTGSLADDDVVVGGGGEVMVVVVIVFSRPDQTKPHNQNPHSAVALEWK